MKRRIRPGWRNGVSEHASEAACCRSAYAISPMKTEALSFQLEELEEKGAKLFLSSCASLGSLHHKDASVW